MMRKIRKTTAFQVKYGGFMVAGEGFDPPDLRVMSSKNAVLYRVTSCEKALKTLAFLNSAFGIVL